MKSILINTVILVFNFLLTFVAFPRISHSHDMGIYFSALMFFYVLFFIHLMVLLMYWLKSVREKKIKSKELFLLFFLFLFIFVICIYGSTVITREYFLTFDKLIR
jgi:hypothetical protein